MPRGVPGPVALARRARRYCLRCGHKTVVADDNDPRLAPQHWTVGRCFYCGATEADWLFLRQPPACRDREVVLHCPYRATAPFRPEEDPAGWRAWHEQHGEDLCAGTFTFKLSDLTPSYGVAGNGPNTYGLVGRYRLQGRCATCDQYASDRQLLSDRNGDILFAAWQEAS